MNLKQPAQYYWTTLIDQYQSHQGLSFAFVPTRSFANNEVPSLEDVATALGTTLFIREIAPWHIPAVLATLLPGTSPNPVDAVVQLTSGSSIFVQPNQLGFAEYVAYSDVIPFEASELKAKSAMAIAALAGVKVGMVTGAAMPPILILTVPLGILLCTAAVELGPQLAARLPRLMGFKK